MNAVDYQVCRCAWACPTATDNTAGQDFQVILEDMDGNRVSALASDYTESLFYLPGREFYDEINHGSRRPRSRRGHSADQFEGVDFTNLNAVELVFDQTLAGTVQVTDLVLQRVF